MKGKRVVSLIVLIIYAFSAVISGNAANTDPTPDIYCGYRDGKLIFDIPAKIATTGTKFKTIGWTASFQGYLLNSYSTTLKLNEAGSVPNGDYVITKFQIPFVGSGNTIMQRFIDTNGRKPEITDFFLHANTIHLKAIMTVVENGKDKGGIYENGSSWGEVYYDYNGIVKARDWTKATEQDLKPYFTPQRDFPGQSVPETELESPIAKIDYNNVVYADSLGLTNSVTFSVGKIGGLSAAKSIFPPYADKKYYAWAYRKQGSSSWILLNTYQEGIITPDYSILNSLQPDKYDLRLTVAYKCANTNLKYSSDAILALNIQGEPVSDTPTVTAQAVPEKAYTGGIQNIGVKVNGEVLGYDNAKSKRIAKLTLYCKRQQSATYADEQLQTYELLGQNTKIQKNFTFSIDTQSKIFQQPFKATFVATFEDGTSLQATDITQTYFISKPVNNVPPVAIIEAPEEVLAGDTVSISGAQSYAIGAIITKYTWSLQGTGDQITAGAGSVKYNTPGTYNINLTVTDSNGLTGIAQKPITVLPPEPKAVITLSGELKENRVMTVSSEGSSCSSSFPIDDSKIEWTIAPIGGAAPIYRIDNNQGTLYGGTIKGKVSQQLGFRKAGQYEITLKVTNNYGLSDIAQKTIVIEPDLAPIVDFSTLTKYIRDNVEDSSSLANFKITNLVRSLDRDCISSCRYLIIYDSNNNESFIDSSDQTVNIGEYNSIIPAQLQYLARYVGKYQLYAEAKESFQTVPGYTTSADFKGANSSSKPTVEKVLEVVNVAPAISSISKTRQQLHININLGDTSYSRDEIESRVNGILKPALLGADIEGNITYTNTVDYKNIYQSFFYVQNSYYNEIYEYNPTSGKKEYTSIGQAKQAPMVVDKDGNIYYIWEIGSALMKWDACQKTKIHIGNGTENIVVGGTAIYSMNKTSGILIQYPTSSIVTQMPNIKFMVALANDNLYFVNSQDKLYEYNPNTDKLTQLESYFYTEYLETDGELVYYGGSIISAYDPATKIKKMISGGIIDQPIARQGHIYYKASDGMHIYDTKTKANIATGEDIVPKAVGWNDTIYFESNGSIYAYDWKKDISTYVAAGTVPRIQYSQELPKTYKSLYSVLSGTSWAEGDRYFLNIDDQPIKELDTKQLEYMLELDRKKVSYYAFGTTENKVMQELLITNTGAVGYYDNGNIDNAFQSFTNELLKKYEISPIVKGYALQGQQIRYENKYSDFETDPIYTERWKYDHDTSCFDNTNGSITDSGLYISTPYTVFEKVGRYDISYQVRDNPKDDINFDLYRLWSNLSHETIYVHRKPIAQFDISAVYNNSIDKYIVNIKDYSFDLDHNITDPLTRGITESKWRFKVLQDAVWIEGIPAEMLKDKIYIVEHTVKDIEGAWSDPYTRIVNTTTTVIPEEQPNNTPPAIDINPYNADWRNTSMSVNINATDKEGIKETKYAWTNTSALPAAWQTDSRSTYQISQGQEGVWYLQAIAIDTDGMTAYKLAGPYKIDKTPPAINIAALADADSIEAAADITDNGGSGLKSIKYQWTSSHTKPTSGWSTNSIATQGINTYTLKDTKTQEGTWYLHIEAADYAGNTYYTCSTALTLMQLKITGVTIQGYWNHWRGQKDMLGKQLTVEPHRFLSLERVKINVNTTGYADKVVIRFSPELELMKFTDKFGNVYDYKEKLGYYVSFPADSTKSLNSSLKDNQAYWEYTLPLAPSTVSWEDKRIKQPYKMIVTAWKGTNSVTYTIDDINITGNVYDLVYIQPAN